MTETQRINPHLFTPDSQKIQLSRHHPKYYVECLTLQGVKYRLKTSQQYRTAQNARWYAVKVLVRWRRLYKAAAPSVSAPLCLRHLPQNRRARF